MKVTINFESSECLVNAESSSVLFMLLCFSDKEIQFQVLDRKFIIFWKAQKLNFCNKCYKIFKTIKILDKIWDSLRYSIPDPSVMIVLEVFALIWSFSNKKVSQFTKHSCIVRKKNWSKVDTICYERGCIGWEGWVNSKMVGKFLKALAYSPPPLPPPSSSLIFPAIKMIKKVH